MRRTTALVILCAVLVALFGDATVHAQQNALLAQAVQGAPVSDLQKHIEEKSVELQKLQEQRAPIEKALEDVGRSKDSISKEIQTYNLNINQLNLSIKSNTVNIEKLNYEIDSLSNEIDNIRNSIAVQKESIGKLFIELQERENETLFERILRSESLSDSVSAIESIATLNKSLNENIVSLQQLQGDYTDKIDQNKKTKTKKEIQKSDLLNLQQITQEQKAEKQRLLEQTKNVEQYYQQQLDELDKKQAEISSVIEEIEHKLRESFDPTLLPLKRPGVLSFPVDDIYITQCYGPTRFAARAYRTKSHNGVDFGGPIGTPVLAADDGKVVKTGNNDRGTSRWNRYQYGKHILIQHSNNLTTLYAHLSKIAVKEGDTVKRGDVIGYLGNTGYAYGPHLHLSVFWAPSVQYKAVPPAAGTVPVGVSIDPAYYLPSLYNVPKMRDAGCKAS